MIIDGVEVTAEGLPDITEEEARAYINEARKEVTGGGRLTELSIRPAARRKGVILSWEARGEKFERIRRITGYLVGTIDRWNNAKRQEEKDRVKHTEGGGDNEHESQNRM